MEAEQAQEFFILMAVGVGSMLAFALAFVVYHNRSQRRIFQHKMEGQQLLLQRTILAQEEERRRIAKDLHDEIGSKLNVMFLHTQQLKKEGTTSQNYQRTLGDLTELINSSIDTTRRISHDLLPPILEEFGLEEALKELSQAYTRTGSLKVDLHIEHGQVLDLDKSTELNLFRIIQELLSNSIKHGKANLVHIRLLPLENVLRILYEDNGKGFEREAIAQHKGLGIQNIESRLQIIDGRWSYDSAPGEGVVVKLEVAPKN